MGLRKVGDHWVWEGGPVPPGSDAITIWRVISVRKAHAANAHLMRHEEEHLRQWRELGFFGFLGQYLGAYFRGRLNGYGHRAAYRLIPLEVEAEQAAVDALAEPDPGGTGPVPLA
jgi:hypothetical protein